MAKMRRVKILEGMFLDIADDEERAKVDELYRQGNKGSAVAFMIRKVSDKWVQLINDEYKRNQSNHKSPAYGFEQITI